MCCALLLNFNLTISPSLRTSVVEYLENLVSYTHCTSIYTKSVVTLSVRTDVCKKQGY